MLTSFSESPFMADLPGSYLLIATFLLLLLQISIKVAQAQESSPILRQISKACEPALYRSVCEACLAPYASQIEKSESPYMEMVSLSLKISVNHAHVLGAWIQKISGSMARNDAEKAALQDCVSVLREAESQIGDCMEVAKHLNGSDYFGSRNDVLTWLSAAMTNQMSCLNGFADVGSSDTQLFGLVAKRVTVASQFVSVALALVNRFPTPYQIYVPGRA